MARMKPHICLFYFILFFQVSLSIISSFLINLVQIFSQLSFYFKVRKMGQIIYKNI